MNNFTLDTVNPPIVTTVPGGTLVWDKRNYSVQYNAGNPLVAYVLIQQLGYCAPNGVFVAKKTELQLALCASAFALVDQTALAAASSNAAMVTLLQAAYTTDQANKRAALPPANLTYPALVEVVDVAMTPTSPTLKGTATSYAVAPALPEGLTLDSTTGIISGTPTSVTAPAVYVVTATNSNGNTFTTSNLSLRVNAAS